ncbi:hypothetical protein GCM10023350_11830 [Nocardioides endophyticus]|uniref:Uncharacterized protein n=1 Tax=Nocardioides endophyticus TaxID=1353775 RepID=A0ABP8YJE9_9ACTN
MSRALSFGSVAAAYERFRPGYPDELVDEVLPERVTLMADLTLHLARMSDTVG